MKCVYCLEFTDGKRYIGSTKNLKGRLSTHRAPCGNKKTNPELKEAILRGGYEVVILEQCPDNYTKEQLCAREQHYIDLWWDAGILYNKHKNARGGRCAGIPGWPSPKKGKKYSKAWQFADNIRADRAAGMFFEDLRIKYRAGVNTIKKVLSEKTK